MACTDRDEIRKNRSERCTWRPAREERDTGAFFLSLSLSVLLAAVVLAASRPFPPLPAIADGNPRLQRSLGLAAVCCEAEEVGGARGSAAFGDFLPSLFNAGAKVFKRATQGKILGWGLNRVGAESRWRARAGFSLLPGREIFGWRENFAFSQTRVTWARP